MAVEKTRKIEGVKIEIQKKSNDIARIVAILKRIGPKSIRIKRNRWKPKGTCEIQMK